jgi:hypothetical protein
MATTLSTAARNAACDGTVDLVDAGAGAGKFRLKNAGGTVIAEVACADPAFGAAATGVATLAGTPRAGAGVAAAGAGDDAATFDLCDSDNNVVLSGAVGVGSGELQLDNINIADEQVVNITAFTHTQPA